MIVHTYAILPFEIGREQTGRAQSLAKTSGWTLSNTPRLEEGPAYRLPNPIKIPDGTEYNVDLAFVDTSACFLLHFSEPQPRSRSDQYEYELAKNILIDRNRLNNYLLRNHEEPVLAETLEILNARDWCQPRIDYVLNFYVLKFDGQPTEQSYNALKIIAHRSAVGVTNETTARNINELDFDSMNLAPLNDLNNIDPDPHTIVYATWSAVVAATWGSTDNVLTTKQMLINMELRLQSLWNRCHQLNKHISSVLDNEESDLDQDGILIDMTRCLQHYQRTHLPSTASTRQVTVFKELITTSLLAKEVSALDGSLPIIERTVERNRELRQREHRYRREIGQDRITVLLVVLTTVGSTQVISTLSSMEGWSQRWWEPVVWIVTGWISYRWTIRRTKQENRN